MDLSLSPFKFLDNQFLAKYLMIPQVEAQIWHLARTCLLGEAFAYCHSFQKSKSGQVMNGKNTIGICFLHLNSLRNPPWLCQKWSWNKDQLGRQRHKEFIIENRLRKLSMIELISQKLAVSLLPGMICETLVCFSLLQLRQFVPRTFYYCLSLGVVDLHVDLLVTTHTYNCQCDTTQKIFTSKSYKRTCTGFLSPYASLKVYYLKDRHLI